VSVDLRPPVSPEEASRILRLHHVEHWPVGTIAVELGRHHDTVERVLVQGGLPVVKQTVRPRMVDAYVPFLKEALAKHPRLRASSLWMMAKDRGYTGSKRGFRAIVSHLRPRPHAEAFLRRAALAGQEAQVDWAHFGKITVGKAERDLFAFVIVLAYSRMRFVYFSLRAAMPSFLRGHVEAFRFFGAVPRVVLYDNLKSAVLEREGDAVRFHPTLLALAGHYRFEPRACAPYRPNEKGRVERAIRDLREGFYAARTFSSVADLNAQARGWCLEIASERRVPDQKDKLIEQAFEEEKPRLVALPGDDYPVEARLDVRVGKTPCVRFDRNDYSVPHTHVRRTLQVLRSRKARDRDRRPPPQLRSRLASRAGRPRAGPGRAEAARASEPRLRPSLRSCSVRAQADGPPRGGGENPGCRHLGTAPAPRPRERGNAGGRRGRGDRARPVSPARRPS
jgi:transposase